MTGSHSFRSSNLRRVLLVALVVVVVLTGLPLMVGMSGCADCDLSDVRCNTACGLLVTLVGLLAASGSTVSRRAGRARTGFSWSLDPPPRLL